MDLRKSNRIDIERIPGGMEQMKNINEKSKTEQVEYKLQNKLTG